MLTLDGIKVCDLTRFVAGPFCTQLLADLGATVIKIEKGPGDNSRYFGPFHNGHCVYWDMLNRNKMSVKIDYRQEEGMKILKEIISKSDAVVENFRPGTLDKMGLTEEVLKSLNPKLVVTHISGFGQTGPFSGRPAFDCISQAMSGIMSITGKWGEDEPVMIGSVYHDYIAGTFAALATVSALHFNKLNPEKAVYNDVDISMLDTALAYSLFATQNYILNDIVMTNHGNRDPSLAPATTFKAADGKYVMIHSGMQSSWEIFIDYIGKPELRDDAKCNTESARMENQDYCEAIVQSWVSSKKAFDIEDELADIGIPCAVVANYGDVVNNPQVKHRGVIQSFTHRDGTEMPVVGPVMKLSATPCEIRSLPPDLGENTVEVLKDYLFYKDEKIQSLKNQKVVL